MNYTGVEVAQLAKVSYRQIDYWCRRGWLPDRANGSGSHRMFTYTEARRVQIAAGLIRAGFHPGEALSIAAKVTGSESGLTVDIGGGCELTVRRKEAS